MNDKIHAKVKELGYCCPYGFFGCNQRKSDSLVKLSTKLDLSVRTISYCRDKIRQGEIRCENQPNCRAAEIERKLSGT
jgi:hypothetical protein